MASHRYWQALAFATPGITTLELSEFHLYDGATRVDAAATLTASTAPSGAIANLKDANTGTGSYWATGGDLVVLSWAFAAKQEVNGINLGARTTASRFPTALLLRGGDAANGTGPSPEYSTYMNFGGLKFSSGAMTGVQLPGNPTAEISFSPRTKDVYTNFGIGRIPFHIKREILPRTTPPTYVDQWARVQLSRLIDGKVIREQWSDPVTGLGSFEDIDENLLYTVTAIYPDSGLRAVIGDRIQPEGYPV